MRISGIATKLFVAFGGIFLLAFIAALIGWQGFQRIADTQNVVIDRAIPGLRHAHELAATNAGIGAASLRLARASTEAERQQISTTLFAHVAALKALLDDFQAQGFAEEQLALLRSTVDDIAANLRQQSELVRQRLKQEVRIENLAAKLVESTAELNELADSLVANAAATTTAITSNLYDLVERDAGQEQLFDVFDRLVEVDIDGMERMYELRLRSSNLSALVNQVTRESDADRLATLRQLSVKNLSILKRRVDEINDPQRKRRAHALLDAMELTTGPIYVYGIFESKLALLDINRKLQQLLVDNETSSRDLDRVVGNLTQAGSSLIGEVTMAARASLESTRILFNWSAIFSLLVAALVLWGYVQRSVIRRLLSLEAATRSISSGKYDVQIDTSGADELSTMAGALETFRDNAIAKSRVDAELQEYKTQLEQLVQERTAELEQANSRLVDIARQNAVARDKAEQANRSKTAFLATMSHELRTPLSGALGTLSLLRDTELSHAQMEYLQTITAANSALLDIVNDILGYSQVEAGKLEVDSRPFGLVALLNTIVDLMAVSARARGNRLVSQFDSGLPPFLCGDAGKLHQILLNLVGNAIKFTEGGTITIRARAGAHSRDGMCRIEYEVQDTGIGIPAERHDEVFRAFTQVDSTTARRQGGVGLGLAICERLVAALGGHIVLDSEPGRGTTVRFDVQMSLTPSTESASAEPGLPLGRPLHVLLVEDDPTNRMVTERYLEKLGHRVLTAEDGAQALRTLKTATVDVVLLDIALPKMDGLTVLKRIREDPAGATRNLPVIAMSAHVFQEEVDRYMNAGMNGFLGKPFSLENLARCLTERTDGAPTVLINDRSNPETLIDRTVVLADVARLGEYQVRSLVEMFASSGEEYVQQIVRHTADRDARAVRDVAHRLRGAAGNFGLSKLCACLVELEHAVGDETPGPVGGADDLQDLFRQSLAELDRVLQGDQASPPAAAGLDA